MDDDPQATDFTIAAVRKLAREMADHSDQTYATTADRRTAMIAQMLINHQDQLAALTRRIGEIETTLHSLEARVSRLEEKQT